MLLDELERSGGSAAQFAGYVGINIRRWPIGFKKRRKQSRSQSALVKTGKGGGRGFAQSQWSMGRSGGGSFILSKT